MDDTDIQIFIDGVKNYFSATTGEEPEIGVPYIKDEDSVVLDYTGAIGVSGKKRGCIYITASATMLEELSKLILLVEDIEKEVLLDMAGELANTIAGNARNAYGSEFMISVPIVLDGKPNDIILQKITSPTYIIPVQWRNTACYVVVGIE